ncbi:anthranilate synthase component I [Brevibacterium sanguinis]|uniref:Anthranilate synthase component 1 n=2 Tax=Brevibacterium TaxID=1696 RepID=A0A366IH47_9MICO|nr:MULTISPECIES: anthranilate synthase component I [Brevibacterium]RBP61605.1 anthranilate synthase component I [Brevibacterium sanguinis]RBP70857.1 anthranilate synthase component I [Brevibacterium celere]
MTTDLPDTIHPSLEEFRTLGAEHRLVPVHRSVLADAETPLSLYRKLTDGGPGSFLFESAVSGAWARYSFIGSAPVATLISDGDGFRWEGTPPVGLPSTGSVLDAVSATLDLLAVDDAEQSLPPMVSSLVGYFGWDIVREFERLAAANPDEHHLPTVQLMIPGDIAVYDHYTGMVTLVANVFNVNGEDTGIDEAHAAGTARVEAMLERLTRTAQPAIATPRAVAPEVATRTDPDSYLAAVRRAQQDIVDGEIFQVVLGQRFDAACAADPLTVYRMLRHTNPSPFMYLLNLRDDTGAPVSIVGSSPEALVTVRSGTVLTHPIAGSRPRGGSAEEDARLARELLADEKERAEHLMLVDLARNDLAKVCRAGTIDVSEFMEIERFSHIMHISSTVRGELAPGHGAVDVLRATFPAGTLSGAPKPRALQIIDELEVVGRGLYGGVVGYMSFNGDLDLAIAIRTGVLRDGVMSVYAGGGIVADSVPELEYQESRNKAQAVLAAAAAAAALEDLGTAQVEDLGQEQR